MRNRELIDRIKRELAAQYPKIQNCTASQGTLTLAVNLQTTTSVIAFNVLENLTSQLRIEKRLKINDFFTITSWGLNLIKAGTTTTASDTEISSAKRYCNPNALVFTAASESANLMNIWNGIMTVKIDRDTIMDQYDCMRFYRVGEAQKGVGPAVITTDDLWQTPNYGMDTVDPEITLSGGGTPEINCVLPNSVNLAGTASTNVLLLQLRGILWQNATAVNGR